MKIITAYISADSGSVNVCGELVHPENINVKQRIGYLPEHNPLYLGNVHKRVLILYRFYVWLSEVEG